jgi:hypothetical protein
MTSTVLFYVKLPFTYELPFSLSLSLVTLALIIYLLTLLADTSLPTSRTPPIGSFINFS